MTTTGLDRLLVFYSKDDLRAGAPACLIISRSACSLANGPRIVPHLAYATLPTALSLEENLFPNRSRNTFWETSILFLPTKNVHIYLIVILRTSKKKKRKEKKRKKKFSQKAIFHSPISVLKKCQKRFRHITEGKTPRVAFGGRWRTNQFREVSGGELWT
jgi:hypothetical protein